MFQAAVQLALGFTRPIVISARYDSGEVQSSMGAFIILNADGWALTCCHIFDIQRQADKDSREIDERDERKDAIVADPQLSPSQRKNQIKKLRVSRRLITTHSYWWGQDNVAVEIGHLSPLADLALVKLRAFDVSTVPNYPVFGNQANPIRPGAALCKLGFPFSEITASWDTTQNGFVLPAEIYTMPRFPLDGMYTRDYIVVDEQTQKMAKYLETSSPGLRGQSGGPTFDQSGVIWAIQSRTRTLDIGFEAKIARNGHEVTEHQAMSVGLGAGIEEIMKLVDTHRVTVQVQP